MSDDEIRALWKDPTFSGSFSGLLTFQNQLLLEKNIKVSTRKLRQILMSVKDYLTHQTRRKHFDRRSYSVHGWLHLLQADLAQPRPVINGFKYLFVAIDLYTLFIWAWPIKDKKPQTIQDQFRKIFEQTKLKPDEIQTDEGGEFVGCRQFFKNEDIFWHIKRGIVKAGYAEMAINWIKKKTYTFLHTTDQDPAKYNWPDAVPFAVDALNSTYHRSLGNLRPKDLNSREKAVLIDRKIGFPKEPNFDDVEKNIEYYLKHSDLFVNDYVYVVAIKNKGQLNSTDRQVLLILKNKIFNNSNCVILRLSSQACDL